MTLAGLREKKLKLILFGGKGGVGKTTCATSTGVYLARDFKTLLLSTDPAHSISDSLEQEIGDEIREVSAIPNLSALEVSAGKELDNFKSEYEQEIKNILDTATHLDQEDIESIFSLPIPGLDEVMGFKTIIDLIEQGKYEKYIVDTAPTGHALRLLSMPHLLDEWVKIMAKMRWKYRYMVESFSGGYTPDKSDDFLLQMKKIVKKIERLIKDQESCEFIAVTIPESMAVLETNRLISDLTKYGIVVKQIVINNVLATRDCGFCQAKRESQEKYIKQIIEKFPNARTTITYLQTGEVKGLVGLKNFREMLFQS